MSFNDYWQAEQRRHAVGAAIAALKPGDQEAEMRLLAALREAVLMVPVAELPEGLQSGDLVVGRAVQVRIAMTKGPDGQIRLPVFTREEHLRRAMPPGQPYVLLPFPAIGQMALLSKVGGVLVDFRAPASAMIAPPLLRLFEQGNTGDSGVRASLTAPAEEKPAPSLRLGPPSRVVSQREIAALHEWLQGLEGCVQAYLFSLVPASGQVTMAVGLGVPGEPPDGAALETMAREVGQILGPVAVLLLDGRLAMALARQPGAIRFDLLKDHDRIAL